MSALAFVLLPFALSLTASAEVSVLNCVNGEDTLDPAGYVSRTLRQWQAGVIFAGVPIGESVAEEISRFLNTRTMLGRELILIWSREPGRVVEVRSPGIACLIRTGEPRTGVITK